MCVGIVPACMLWGLWSCTVLTCLSALDTHLLWACTEDANVIMHLALHIAFDSQYAHLPLLCVQNDQTALIFASWKGYKEIVELLLQKKADVSIRNKVHVI